MNDVLSKTGIEWAPWPVFSDEQIAKVTQILRSGRVNQWTGSEVWDFEREYAAYLGRAHAVAVMNGTSALELALKALSVGEGDEVITTPRTFVASASSAVLQGAVPVFADVDEDSGNITAATIERVITRRTKAIIVVHLAGWPADMGEIVALARSHGISVIEDCAQAHGAQSQGRHVGSFGDIAAFSFCQDKIITTGGEGGLVALDDETAWNTAWSYKDHGKSHEAVFQREHAPGFRWLHESFGTNWRMTEIQAALGRIQLRDLADIVAVRNANASLLREALTHQPALRIPVAKANDVHAYYKFYVYLVPRALKSSWDRDRIQAELAALGVPVTSGSCSEVYREVAFTSRNMGPTERLPVAVALGETSLMLQVHPGLSREALAWASEKMNEVLERATR